MQVTYASVPRMMLALESLFKCPYCLDGYDYDKVVSWISNIIYSSERRHSKTVHMRTLVKIESVQVVRLWRQFLVFGAYVCIGPLHESYLLFYYD